MGSNELAPKGGDILIYQTEGGQTKIQVRLEGETLWLSQADLAQLYQTTIPNINIHIKNIYDEDELLENAIFSVFSVASVVKTLLLRILEYLISCVPLPSCTLNPIPIPYSYYPHRTRRASTKNQKWKF